MYIYTVTPLYQVTLLLRRAGPPHDARHPCPRRGGRRGPCGKWSADGSAVFHHQTYHRMDGSPMIDG